MKAGEVIIPSGWPRPATPCDLKPQWAGEFRDFDDWVNFAPHRLAVPPGHPPAVCIDARGRRCWIGWQFQRAHDEGAFPIRYFWECE